MFKFKLKELPVASDNLTGQHCALSCWGWDFANLCQMLGSASRGHERETSGLAGEGPCSFLSTSVPVS